jgi:hypothetical protein
VYTSGTSPMSLQRFRLNAAVIATTASSGRSEIVYLPEGAEILAIDPVGSNLADPPNLRVSVEWEHNVFSAFAVDIRERSEPLRSCLSAVRHHRTESE